MRNFTKLLVTAYLVASGCLISSCNKETAVPDVNPYVSVMNASPTAATYYLYLNGTKATSGALSLGGFVTYQQVASGNLSVKLTDGLSNELIMERSVTTDVNNVYSLFLIGKDDEKDILLVTDKFPDVSSDKAYVRLINFSPDAGPLDLVLADNTILSGDHTYKAASGFVPVDSGTYSFAINDSESGVLKYQLAGQTLAAGKVYSVVALGMNNPADTDRGFSAEFVTNY